MLVVGLTGGIATGKSTVASLFATLGAAVIDADRIAHALQEPGTPCHRQIVDAFGPGMLDGAGRIDRGRLGRLVFQDAAARRRLEAIMHPAIRHASEAAIRRAEAAGNTVCIVEGALILESGRRDRFERIIVVVAPEDVQVERLARTRGLSVEEARQRLASQWTSAAKAALADHVIDNGGDLAKTEAQVAHIYTTLKTVALARQKMLDKAEGRP